MQSADVREPGSNGRVRISLLIVLGLLLGSGGCSDDAAGVSPAGSEPPATGATTAAPTTTTTTTTAAPTTPAPSADAVEIRWFGGLHSGYAPETIWGWQEIVDLFNATYGAEHDIRLVPDFYFYDGVPLMQEEITEGSWPDIAGPMGIAEAARFFGSWLDISPYLADHDVSDFDPTLVELFNQDGVQIGLPYGVGPKVLWFNKDMFDAAGLAYPPQQWGAPYVDAAGTAKPWDIDTLRELAIALTLDANGLTPSDAGFDPDTLVQWGFGNLGGTGYSGVWWWTDFRGAMSLFGGGSFVADDNVTCQFPEHWRTAANWYHDAIWEDYFHPDETYGHYWGFAEGRIAMAATGGIASRGYPWRDQPAPDLTGGDWTDPNDVFDIAALPAVDGIITATLGADTFGIPKGTAHPDEAAEVLLWMMSPEITSRLLLANHDRPDVIPARTSAQRGFVADPANDYGITWRVVFDALRYPDIPNHAGWLPAYQESSDAVNGWWTALLSDPDADVDAGIDQLCDILQPIWDQATG